MKKFVKQLIIVSSVIAIAFSALGAASVHAFSTEQIFSSGEHPNDFVVGEGKAFITLDPGQSITKEILVTNRLGKEATFVVGLSDFTGGGDGIAQLTDKSNPYSLKSYITPEVNEFTLKDMERGRLQYTISLPDYAKPGGMFGVITIGTKEAPSEVKNDEGATIKVKTQIAYLLFVRVRGDANEDGMLKDFKTDKEIYEYGPIPFSYSFENNGNVHLLPYGTIEIKNMFGKKISELELVPFYTIPGTIRTESTALNKKFMFGKYKATINLNRGYIDVEDIIDSQTISFWVIPWKWVLVFVILLALVIWLIVTTIGQYKISKR